ncbi:MAG: zinc ABC transporter substrate-binding protein [Candidatus Omnitrophica bacterium]|nr:zinc ABC transporter substrate-binding protein [Candidatus Omnitrophota bacterium]
MSYVTKFLNIGKVMLLAFLIIGLGLSTARAEKIKAIATISIIGDVLKNVAGDKVDLVVLVGPNGDAHEYEPIPADSVSIAKADIIFENGLHLEHWLDKLYMASGSKAKRIVVSQGVAPRIFEDNPNETDPHAWQDVSNVVLYTKNIRDALVSIDPLNKDIYDSNVRNYIQQLQVLDAWVKAQVASIPVGKRKLVTNHDDLGYFAGRYGFKIIGAVIPSATTEAADPSAKQTADLLNIIRANGVCVIFSENMANPKLARSLSHEAGIEIGPLLYTDALGPSGSEGGTYLSMIKYNVEIFRKYLK